MESVLTVSDLRKVYRMGEVQVHALRGVTLGRVLYDQQDLSVANDGVLTQYRREHGFVFQFYDPGEIERKFTGAA